MKTKYKYSAIMLGILAASLNANANNKSQVTNNQLKKNIENKIQKIQLLPPEARIDEKANLIELPSIDILEDKTEKTVTEPIEINSSDIKKNNAVDLKTAIKDVPGVEVISLQNARQGNDSVNIRGLSDNRVGMSIDGINLPEANENKHVSSMGPIFGRGGYIEPSSLKSISISKNSDGKGLSGSINMRTLNPSDLLNGEDMGGLFEISFNNVDNSALISQSLAISKNNWRTLLVASARKGNETKNKGDKDVLGTERTKPNPLKYFNPYILLKHEFDINNQNTIKFTAENFYRKQSLNYKSELSGVTTTKYQGEDENRRSRLSASHNYKSSQGFINEIETTVYWQQTSTESKNNMEGLRFESLYPSKLRRHTFNKKDNFFGLSSTLNHQSVYHLNFADIDYKGQYTFDINYQKLTSNLDTNYAGHFVSGKPVANSVLLPINLIANNDIKIKDFMINIGLGLHYHMHKPDKEDKEYIVKVEGDISKIKKTSAFNVTPKIGLAWQAYELVTPYLQYARGFKAPSPQQLTSTMASNFYSIWGNPELKAETSNNFDLGIKGENEKIQYNINAYYNIYSNFIDMIQLKPSPIPRHYLVYQAQNKQKATIYGIEASGKWNFYQNVGVNGLVSYAKGEVKNNNDDKKTPLNSIDPPKIKLGLTYDKNTYGFNIDISHNLAKKDKDLNKYAYAMELFNPSVKYTLVDLGAYWQPTKNLTVNANINNLLNKKYWKWSDVAYLNPSSTQGQEDANFKGSKDKNKDRYTAPGRNFNVGLKYTF